MLVEGAKVWELRTTSTKVRGRIGIAAKGSGSFIGAVDLVGVHGPYSPDEASAHEAQHRVPRKQIEQYSGPKGLYAWEVTAAHRFNTPVPYTHPQGAVIWVRLEPAIAEPDQG